MINSHKILIVEDEPGLVLSLVANLRLAGFEVLDAASGEIAIEMVRHAQFGVVIADIKLPGKNGIETIRAIRKLRPDMPVLFMTGFASEELIRQGMSEGAYALLYKPFKMDHLIRLVQRALSRPIVLVVDDEPAQAEALAAAIRAAGVPAEAVFDGLQAVMRIFAGDIDVCVTDLVMPGMNGTFVFEAIHARDPSVAVIAVTGHSDSDQIDTFIQKGGTTCLRKPVNPTALVRAISRARHDYARL